MAAQTRPAGVLNRSTPPLGAGLDTSRVLDVQQLVAGAASRHAGKFAPCALLVVNGGRGEAIRPGEAQNFVDTRPCYAATPELLASHFCADSGHVLEGAD